MTDFSLFSLEDWLQHIQAQHWRTIEMQLDRIRSVWTSMSGEIAGGVITVAGTNGKGSSIAMLEAIYIQAGYKVGSYTSPHLVRYNERVKINGIPVDDHLLCETFTEIEQARADTPLTYFEFGTLCALRIFQNQAVDICLLEVGMGGTYDAVNMVDNHLALITNIGLDHQQWLGSDLEGIAREKAGVIKQNSRVVVADRDAPQIIKKIAAERSAAMSWAGEDFHCQTADPLNHPVDVTYVLADWRSDGSEIQEQFSAIEQIPVVLAGSHQITNLGGVIAAVVNLVSEFPVTESDIKQGLMKVKILGRCEIVQSDPLIIVDVAHNEDSASELASYLQTCRTDGLTHAVVGILEDKVLDDLFKELLPEVDLWYFAGLTGERGQTGEALAEKFEKMAPGHRWTAHENPISAYIEADRAAKPQDRVVIFGSFYTVGDIIAHREAAS